MWPPEVLSNLHHSMILQLFWGKKLGYMWIYISQERCLNFIHQIWLFEILIITICEKHGFSCNMHTSLSFVLFWVFRYKYILKVYVLLEWISLWISLLTGYKFLTSFSTVWLFAFLIHYPILQKIFLFLNYGLVVIALLTASILVSVISSLEYSNLWPISVMLWVAPEFLEGKQNFVMDFPWDWYFIPSPSTTQLL